MRTGLKSALTMVVLAIAFPVALATQAAPDTVILKGSTFGGVKFAHAQHEAQTECVVCHHVTRPEMPNTAEYATCKSCHTETVEPPMVTNARDAFHDRRAREGLCVTCHISRAEEGASTPARCSDCHKPDQG